MRWGLLFVAAALLLVCQSVDTAKPSVKVVAPDGNDTIPRGHCLIKAVATDAGGVDRVDFSVDTVLLGADSTAVADTYSFAWNDSAYVVGSFHMIRAKAWDQAGNAAVESIAVTIGPGVGPTVHNHDISASETWYASGNPHIVEANINVKDGATLTIEPGCVVRFNADYELRCGYAGDAGAIVAVGTADSLITFTSNAAAPVPGDWSNIGVYEAALAATQFKYCALEYAGSSSGYGTIYVYGSSTKIDNCRISNSKDRGVVVEGEAALGSFTNNTITTCARYPVSIPASCAGILGAGNTLTGNASGSDAIELESGNVTETQTWLNHGVPYVLTSTVSVVGAGSPELTIAPGTTVKLRPGVEFRCGMGGQNGAIIADGTSGRITFTCAATPPAPGSWDYISFYEATLSSARLVDCDVEYGGGYGNIYIYNATPTITGCNIRYSDNWGIYLDGSVYPDPVQLENDNTYTGNATGSVRVPPTN